MAEYENEVRSERIRAGQAAARAKGVTWGGKPQGIYFKVTPDQESSNLRLRQRNRTRRLGDAARRM